MYVTGTSLGGNVMTKLLGELGEDAVNYGILGGAVACGMMPLSLDPKP
jgi:predicted alpha/beta-fold hydrolase